MRKRGVPDDRRAASRALGVNLTISELIAYLPRTVMIGAF